MQELWPLSSEIIGCILSLYGGFVILGLLGIYLHEIVPSDFGVSKEPFWMKWCSKPKSPLSEWSSDDVNLEVGESEEDEDAKAERSKVASMSIHQFAEYPLICKDLRKVYKATEGRASVTAVQNFSLRIEPGEIFGLLGPNGAGKTTIISMLTGLYAADSGNAWIGGNDIQTNLAKVQLNIGVCPQFDLLWP